tara:strand:+ start:88 stop:648 length:561 start_codon:yes stop_codon:yes gene_type:complete
MKYKSKLLGATIYFANSPSLLGQEVKGFVAFWGGILSNWAKSDFVCDTLFPDITLNCVEQGMMLMKASLFRDHKSFDKILKENDPRIQKALGRQVKNFDSTTWNKVVLDYVSKLCYDKFTQNEEWGELLKLTYPLDLVEASPYDKVWGIGLAEDDPKIIDRQNWKGKNWLGEALMIARDRILDERS